MRKQAGCGWVLTEMTRGSVCEQQLCTWKWANGMMTPRGVTAQHQQWPKASHLQYITAQRSSQDTQDWECKMKQHDPSAALHVGYFDRRLSHGICRASTGFQINTNVKYVSQWFSFFFFHVYMHVLYRTASSGEQTSQFLHSLYFLISGTWSYC